MLGSAVELHSLVNRPELNGLRGVVIGDADPATGRHAVRVDLGDRTIDVLLLPTNLINLTAEAIGSVFSDPDLLKLIVKHIKRSARVGIMTGVCNEWRSCIYEDPDLYRSIVVLTDLSNASEPDDPRLVYTGRKLINDLVAESVAARQRRRRRTRQLVKRARDVAVVVRELDQQTALIGVCPRPHHLTLLVVHEAVAIIRRPGWSNEIELLAERVAARQRRRRTRQLLVRK